MKKGLKKWNLRNWHVLYQINVIRLVFFHSSAPAERYVKTMNQMNLELGVKVFVVAQFIVRSLAMPVQLCCDIQFLRKS